MMKNIGLLLLVVNTTLVAESNHMQVVSDIHNDNTRLITEVLLQGFDRGFGSCQFNVAEQNKTREYTEQKESENRERIEREKEVWGDIQYQLGYQKCQIDMLLSPKEKKSSLNQAVDHGGDKYQNDLKNYCDRFKGKDYEYKRCVDAVMMCDKMDDLHIGCVDNHMF